MDRAGTRRYHLAMAHIALPEGLPGILGPMAFRPETAEPLNALAEVLLRGDSTLSRGERELIAMSVSAGNDCAFCATAHGAFARVQLDDGEAVTRAVLEDYAAAPISDKLKALLDIASKVRVSGKAVTAEDVERARAHGATDIELHDTVLIAAAFCMYNRYVDGLGTWAPPDRQFYVNRAPQRALEGYQSSVYH